MSTNEGVGGPVQIGSKLVGDGHPSYIIAEIGINHNGDIDLARRLISVAEAAGCIGIQSIRYTRHNL